jgi:hypothetical protein
MLRFMALPLGPRSSPLLDRTFPLPLELPFTSKQAAEAGISRHALARLLREGLVRRVLKGVYVAAQLEDSQIVRAHALKLAVPDGAVLCDWTACWLYTGVLPPGEHLEVPPISLFRLAGAGRLRNELCRSGERTFLPKDVTVIDGLVVATPLRTALDLGRLAGRDMAIGALDALLRHGDYTHDELLGAVERFAKQRGVVQLRELAPLADARAESPGESVLRLRWLDCASLPTPTPQVPILAPDGTEMYRIDLGVEDIRFGAEYDGEAWHSNPEDVDHDNERRTWLWRERRWTIKPVRKHNVFGYRRDVESILYQGVVEARRRMGEFHAAG